MSLFLSKLIPTFVYPLGFAIVLGLLALTLYRHRRVARLCMAASVLVAWVSSAPAFSKWFCLAWEEPYHPVETGELPHADAIVVLGGILEQSRLAKRPELNEAADRVFEAAELFHAAKAQRIVVVGGNLPWRPADAAESAAIAGLLVELGVPREAIVIETTSRNTHENAVNAAAIFRANGWQTALLVTSADHMRRARASFLREDIAVTPAPCDAHGRYPFFGGALDLLPDVDALSHTTSVVKEMIGMLYYSARGWI